MFTIDLYLFLCYTEAAFIKKIQVRGGQCGGKQQGKGGKGKREKDKGEKIKE